MPVVGITGSFGTGKTTVAGIFRELGAAVIDADKLAHQQLKANSAAYKKIILHFGRGIRKDGSSAIDRKKLAKIVFNDREALKKLNRIIHPLVIREIRQGLKKIEKDNPNRVVAVEAPLLIEAGLLNLVDKLVVVIAKRNLQVSRIIKAKGLSSKEIAARIRAQLPLREKIKSADYVVDNNGSLTYTKKQVRDIWEEISQYPPTLKRFRLQLRRI